MFHSFKLLGAPLLSLAFLLCVSASAVDTAPEKPVGLIGTNDALGIVEFTPHNLPGAINDYALRARSITIEPNGAIHNHSHAGRPGIVRVTKGNVLEIRGTSERTLKAGDYWFENADTMHWFKNPSKTETAEIWVVDLVTIKK